MLFSYSWLKELSGTKRSPQKLAELLMTHAFEVESVEPYPHGLENVVVGKVLSVTQHPNADRLRVAKVNVGKQEVREIVCGAPNLAVHQKVAVALPGAHLPGGIVIKESELRGVVSQGMICSAKELNLGTDHAGILVLSADAPVGKSFAEYAGLDDTVLDVKILPDRSCDALSYRGLAHEIAALEGMTPRFSEAKLHEPAIKKNGKAPKVTLKTERSLRYIALVLETVHETTTPLQAQVRLILSGLRPIGPLVDLTNYLMLETGQPIHAFDGAHIPKGGIVVREAKAKEKLTLLDGTILTLSSDDLVIADTKKSLALAGVMGGKDSGISETTKRVVFELAHFDRASIRRTEKRYRLLTDAAYRFERGIDMERPKTVALLLATRAAEWGIGEGWSLRDVHGKLPKPTTLVVELETVASLLGVKIPLFEVVQYCSWLGLSVKKLPNRSALSITVPLSRPDLTTPEDIVEEIGRMRGYETIPLVPLPLLVRPVEHDPMKRFERETKECLVALGFDEVMTYSFYHEKQALLSGTPTTEHLKLANPMNPDQEYLRVNLFPNLLSVVLLNAKHLDQLACFEYGSIFGKGDGAPREEKSLALAHFEKESADPEASFLRFKAQLEGLFEGSNVEVRFETLATHIPPYFHPTRVAHLVSRDGRSLGFAGAVLSEALSRFGKKALCLYAELSVELMQELGTSEYLFRGMDRFPLAERDISLIGPQDISFARLLQVIQSAGAPLLKQSELFDVYVTETEKSFALHLGFGSGERTLTGDEVDQAFERIVRECGEHLGMRLKLS